MTRVQTGIINVTVLTQMKSCGTFKELGWQDRQCKRFGGAYDFFFFNKVLVMFDLVGKE